MFERIVLAYDGKEASAVALKQASDLAFIYRAQLSLIGIVSSIPVTALADPYPQDDLLGAGSERMRRSLRRAAEELRSRGLKVATEVLQGNPVTEMASYAKSIDADLLVLGHSEKDFISRWFEGSTGAKLIRDLPCSLLIATSM